MYLKLKYNMMKRVSLFVLFIVALSVSLQAQEKGRNDIRKGNKLYEENKYNDAEISYRKAAEKNAESVKAAFNIGDALYKQKNYKEAAKQFNSLAQMDLDRETKAKVYHNLGNAFLKDKQLKESIEAYENALRNNSKDMDTKYNLAYAQKLLKKQQQQQKQNKNQQNKNNKQQQNKNQQNKNQQDKQNNQQQNKNNQQQQQNQQQQKSDQQQQKGNPKEMKI